MGLGNLAGEVAKSGASRVIGGALCGGVIVIMILNLWRNFGSQYALLCLGGLLLAALFLIFIYYLWKYVHYKNIEYMEKEHEKLNRAKQKKKKLKQSVSEIKENLIDALTKLKSKNLQIYSLPWFLLIGEPKSGKTTTLKQSDIEFPPELNNKISGAGGTVNCDWWFPEGAVIIDTAGRLTMTVDSTHDQEEWIAFLRLLSKYRPRCPINGVIVTIPTTSLLEDPDDIIFDKANRIRKKLDELTMNLNVDFPVYIMVSKLDIVFGFTEFCKSISQGKRKQIVGWDRPSLIIEPFDKSEFETQFDNQVQTIYKMSLNRLNDEEVKRGDESDRVFSFSSEFQALKAPLIKYFDLIFKRSDYRSPLFLRGCYFSSGIQEGRSILKALGEIGAHKETHDRIKKSFGGSRPYFIDRFYEKVFKEKGLVTRTGYAAKRDFKLKITCSIITILLLIISAMILIPGMTMLSDVIKPINSEVNFIKANYHNTKMLPASQLEHSISLFQSLDNGCKNLSQSSLAWRFTKSKENFVVYDIKTIQNIVLLKGVIRPLISLAGECLEEFNINNEEDKTKLIAALQQYLLLLSKVKTSEININPILEIIQANKRLPNLSPQIIMNIWKQYPIIEINADPVYDSARSKLKFRKGFSKIRDYWKQYSANQWDSIENNIFQLDQAYQTLLSCNIDMLQDQITKYISRANLIRYNNEKLATITTPDKLFEICQSDYKIIQKSLSGFTSKGIYKTVNRHADECINLKNDSITLQAQSIKKFGHIIKEDGSLNPEIDSIISGLKKIQNIQPFFSMEKQRQLNYELNRILTTIEAWGAEWKNNNKQLLSDISLIYEKVLSPGWKKEKLLSLISEFLDELLFEADRELALAAMKKIIPESEMTSKNLRKGEIPPLAAKSDWLLERFDILLNIENRMQTYYSTRDLKDISSLKENIMKQAYQYCLKFWDRTIRSYDPATNILKTGNFKSYIQEVNDVKGIFIDIGNWPLNMFLENMSTAKINELKNKIGENRGTEARKLERSVSKTAYVYGGNLISSLEDAQAEFLKMAESFDENTSYANINVTNFNQLSKFKEKVDRDSFSRGERFARRLEKIEGHGKRLLTGVIDKTIQAGCDNMNNDLQKNISSNKIKFENYYPFISNRGITDTVEGLYINDMLTISSKMFKKIYFTNNTGIYALQQKLEQLPPSNTDCINYKEDYEKFFNDCLLWRNFLYDDKMRVKKQPLKIILDTTNKKEKSYAGRQYTVFNIYGFNEKAYFRFSGNSYRSVDLLWSINLGDSFIFEVLDDVSKTDYAKMKISGGNLVLLAYLQAYGKETERLGINEWLLDINIPTSYYQGNITKYASVKLIFKWETAIPDVIEWPVQ